MSHVTWGHKSSKGIHIICKQNMLIGFIITGFFLKVLLLTNFKQCDEDCPVPEDVRDTLGEFHNNLLLHCGEKILVSLQV